MNRMLPHQVKYAHGYKDKELVVWEGGTGKTIAACLWLRDGRDRNALVICPKKIIGKWQEALADWETKATVVSKEQFKKLPPRRYSAIVTDEADEFASPLFSKGRSQLSTALYNQIKDFPSPILLLTATPIRSNPWNLHTLLTYRGVYINWKRWREEFFTLERRPYLPRPAWLPKPDWRSKMRPLLEKYADIVLMKDCVGYLPPSTETSLSVPCSPYKREVGLTPGEAFVAEHRHEQEHKAREILKIAREYRKVLVVAYYVEQVKELQTALEKDRPTFAVWGGCNNQEETLKWANETDECFLIVQASLGVGFDADTFSCVIFASLSYGVRNLVQMKWRVRRIKNLHPVQYYYLLGGRCDRAVKETVEAGREFIPSEWIDN